MPRRQRQRQLCRSQGHVLHLPLYSFSFPTQWRLPPESLGSLPNCLEIIFSCFLKWLFRIISCYLWICGIGWHSVVFGMQFNFVFFHPALTWKFLGGNVAKILRESELPVVPEWQWIFQRETPSNHARGQTYNSLFLLQMRRLGCCGMCL